MESGERKERSFEKKKEISDFKKKKKRAATGKKEGVVGEVHLVFVLLGKG